jgi:hypothetical protein
VLIGKNPIFFYHLIVCCLSTVWVYVCLLAGHRALLLSLISVNACEFLFNFGCFFVAVFSDLGLVLWFLVMLVYLS